MEYEIEEIRNSGGATYWLARYWETKRHHGRGLPAYYIEDFRFDLTNRDGLDVFIKAKVDETWDVAVQLGMRGDNTSNLVTEQDFFVRDRLIRHAGVRVKEPIVRDDADPKGLLARPEVQALIGKPQNRPDAPTPEVVRP